MRRLVRWLIGVVILAAVALGALWGISTVAEAAREYRVLAKLEDRGELTHPGRAHSHLLVAFDEEAAELLWQRAGADDPELPQRWMTLYPDRPGVYRSLDEAEVDFDSRVVAAWSSSEHRDCPEYLGDMRRDLVTGRMEVEATTAPYPWQPDCEEAEDPYVVLMTLPRALLPEADELPDDGAQTDRGETFQIRRFR